MTRTIVDIPEEHINLLDSIGKKESLSRAELVRRAVESYLEAEQSKSAGAIEQYFGMFKDDPSVFEGLSGLEYERKMRGEWDERDEDIERNLANYKGFHEE